MGGKLRRVVPTKQQAAILDGRDAALQYGKPEIQGGDCNLVRPFSPVAAGLELLDFLDAKEARARLRILGPAKLSSTDIGVKRRDRDAQHLGRFLRVDEIRPGCMIRTDL